MVWIQNLLIMCDFPGKGLCVSGDGLRSPVLAWVVASSMLLAGEPSMVIIDTGVCASQVRFHHSPDKRAVLRVQQEAHVSAMEHMCLVFVGLEHIDLKQIQYNASHVLRKRTLLRVV